MDNDYQEVGSSGPTSYEQTKRLFISLDGKHPKEFLQSLFLLEKGFEPTAQEEERICTQLCDPDFLKAYPGQAKQMAEQLKHVAVEELKTVQFVSVKGDGMQAVAALTFRMPESPNELRETVSLRKTDGVWRISRRVIED